MRGIAKNPDGHMHSVAKTPGGSSKGLESIGENVEKAVGGLVGGVAGTARETLQEGLLRLHRD